MTNYKTPTWFWIIAGIALLWNLMGVGAFISDMLISPESIAELPEAEQNLYDRYPFWTKIAYAVAVFGGALGALGLLMKKAWAKPLFIVSFIGVIVQMFHSLFIAKATEVYGPGSVVMPILVVIISAFLIWFSTYSFRKGWIQ